MCRAQLRWGAGGEQARASDCRGDTRELTRLAMAAGGRGGGICHSNQEESVH